MKKIYLIVGCLTFTMTASAKNIINWHKDNGGRNGYNKIDQVYTGTTSHGNDMVWDMNCTDPGRELCKFQTSSSPDYGNLDDLSLFIASEFFVDMNDEIDSESLNSNSGTWTKNIISNTPDGRTFKTSIVTTWKVTASGSLKIRTVVDGSY